MASRDDDAKKLLIIDDDQALLRALELYLDRHSYQVTTARRGNLGLRKLYESHPDLVVLDVMMPGMDGWEILKRIRELTDLPVIMLTARDAEQERIKGLKMGADDYVAKPFSMRELEARIEAVLRRSRGSEEDEREDLVFADNHLEIDRDRAEVRCAGTLIDLTPTEQRLLFLLAQNQGRLLTFDQILTHVWGSEYTQEKGYVRLYVWRLRQKIEPDPESPIYIQTEHGLGYRFAKHS
jgi:two-component system KDP operon response regulator KdpE